MSSRRIVAVVPAAGSGIRMASVAGGPKQLMLIHGKSILFHTVNALLQVNSIKRIVVVTSEALFDRVHNDLHILLDIDKSR